MSWTSHVLELCNRFGSPAKFAVTTILRNVLPGASSVVDVIEKAFECAHETARDHWVLQLSDRVQSSAQDVERMQQMLRVVSSEMSHVVAQLAQFEKQPEVAKSILEVSLTSDRHCRQAVGKLEELAGRFDQLEEQNRNLLAGQGYTHELIEEMLPLLRRMTGVADFVEGLVKADVKPGDFAELLSMFREAQQAFGKGDIDQAATQIQNTLNREPNSGPAHSALAAVDAARSNFPGMEKNLARAVELCPDDDELARVRQRVTQASVRDRTPLSVDTAITPPNALKVGATVDGWLLKKVLGRGGWGQVFLAHRRGETRALKIMHPNLANNAFFVERFKSEILLLAGLRGHPHLVEIHGFGFDADKGCWYFVMEYVEGVSLEFYLQKKGPLTAGQARPLFTALADGLAAAHHRGVTHRDIKPANILLRADGRPVLVDFGIAAVDEGVGVKRSQYNIGFTTPFASPEQLRGKLADARSDVYCLAAAMYYSLCFDQPDYREPDRFESDLAPQEMRELLSAALHPNPNRRPEHAGYFRDMLRASKDHTPAKEKAWPKWKADDLAVWPRQIKVDVFGECFARTPNDLRSYWQKIGDTPAAILFEANSIYGFLFARGARDEDLASLLPLQALPNFRWLHAGSSRRITDFGLSSLTGFQGLHLLNLTNCRRITNAGLEEISRIRSLRELHVAGCRNITDDGLRSVAELPHLQWLDLASCRRITDSGLAVLADAQSLRWLVLRHCDQLTLNGVEQLAKLPTLQWLDLGGCGFSVDEHLELKELLPQCAIHCNGASCNASAAGRL